MRIAFGATASLVVAAALVVTGCKKDEDGEVVTEDIELDTANSTGPLEVEISDETALMHFCGDYGDTVNGTVWQVTDPDGNLVWDAFEGVEDGFRSATITDMAISLIPQTPALELGAGTWKINYYVNPGHPGTVACGQTSRSSSAGGSATIPVEIVLVSTSFDASAAPDDAGYKAAIAKFEEEWGTAGVDVDITVKDFEGDAGAYDIVEVDEDDMGQFNDLLRTADPDDAAAITFFWVEEVESSDGASILGLSAGPPGAAAAPGTSKSGVIVTTVDLGTNPEDVGKIMSHEGGHFLGLWHTSEKDGGEHDFIDDTPQCTNDADGNGQVNTSECGGSGAENVMFWTLTQGTAELSDDQAWVMRQNPAAD